MEWGRAEEKVDPCCAPPRAHYVRKWNNAGYRRPGLEQSVGALRRPLSGVIRRRKRSLLPLGEVASATSTTSLLQYFSRMPTGAASAVGVGTCGISGGSRGELRFTPGNGTVKSILAGRS